MACLNGNYTYPSPPEGDYSSFSENFVRADSKGAIALWSATGLGLAAAHDYLNKGLFEAIFFDDIAQLGLATSQAKLYLYTHTGGYRDQIDTFLLFGDPASRLNVAESDVSLNQAVGTSGTPQQGDQITYTLSFSNTGQATAHNVVVSDALPAALIDPIIVSTGTAIAQRAGSSLVWDIADLPAGQSGVITISATIDPEFAGALLNPVTISTSARESNLLNNAPDPLATMFEIYDGAPTAVDLISFTATPVSNTIVVAWQTANELSSLGFNLYRAPESNAIETKLNATLIPAQSPGSTTGAAYTHIDSTANPGETYRYWLESVDSHGTTTLHNPVSATLAIAQPTVHQIFLPFVVSNP